MKQDVDSDETGVNGFFSGLRQKGYLFINNFITAAADDDVIFLASEFVLMCIFHSTIKIFWIQRNRSEFHWVLKCATIK